MVPQSYASNTGPPNRPRRSEPIFPELPKLYAAFAVNNSPGVVQAAGNNPVTSQEVACAVEVVNGIVANEEDGVVRSLTADKGYFAIEEIAQIQESTFRTVTGF
jgi:hypothetical protein